MSGPFGNSEIVGQPAWGTIIAKSGNFSKVDVSGQPSIPEVGYDEGGYGEGGYDAPTQNFPSASTPNWTLYTLK